MANTFSNSYSCPLQEQLKTPFQILIFGRRRCAEDADHCKYLLLYRPCVTLLLCHPSQAAALLMPDITQPARTNHGHPERAHPPRIQVSPPGAVALQPWLGDSTRAGLTWLCRAPPNRGHQVVQSHCSGSGAICPSGHEHRGSGMCQGVLAARAIPWCC